MSKRKPPSTADRLEDYREAVERHFKSIRKGGAIFPMPSQTAFPSEFHHFTERILKAETNKHNEIVDRKKKMEEMNRE